MTQSHKNKQTLQVLTRKSFGKWKRKNIVLKKSVENQRTGELHIYHPLQSKAIRKIYSRNATVIQISPHSHAVIHSLTEDSMQNVLCLLKLQENNQDDSPCQFFYASTEQEASDLHKLGNTIQELCEVNTFPVDVQPVDVQSTNDRIPAGPAFLHFSKNRVYLSSKTSTITILKKWQFHSLQTFHFEVRGIHIYDTEDNSRGEVFVSCKSTQDNRRIQQIISLQCSPRIPVHREVVPRRPSELSMLQPSTSSQNNSVSSLSPCSSEIQMLSSTSSVPESPVFLNFANSDVKPAHFGCQSISNSTKKLQKPPLTQTESSPIICKKRIQSPKHSVKEHVDIRFPTQKRSKSISDLRIRPLYKDEQVIVQMRAFSMDSNCALILQQKPKAWRNKFIKSSVNLSERHVENKTESNYDFNNNEENTGQGTGLDACQEVRSTLSGGAQALPPHAPKPEQFSTNKQEPKYVNYNYPGPDSWSYENDSVTDSPHYENFETRPNCYMYRNMCCLDDAPEIPKTYVNVFSGSSIKGCYENCHSGVYDHEFVYSSIDELIDVPPPVPKPRRPPPRLPPRVNKLDSHREMYPGIGVRKGMSSRCPLEVPQLPPKRPPKSLLLSAEIKRNLKPQADISSTADIQATPKIQVALFASQPTCGLVWFLRVAFMHQNENDTTYKRVKGIEEASNHRLVKSELLEVFTDINVALNVQTKGFDLLNESQQEVESSDLDNLRKGDWFVIEFRVKQSDMNQVQFDGDVSVGPKANVSCRRACKVSFGISENFLIMSPVSPTEKPTTTKPLKINFSQYERLCKALDPITNSSRDWRHVADAMEFTREDIQSLVAKYHRNVRFSPTEAILEAWEQRDPNCSLDRLVNILREVERFDVVQDLGYSIEPKEKLNDGFKKI